MINKQDFVKYLSYIKKTMGKEEKINNFIEDISSDGYAFILSDEISHMIEMLCSCVGVEYNKDDAIGDDIQYFIYDLEFGTKWEPGRITEADGTDIDISTPEKLYDYITRE